MPASPSSSRPRRGADAAPVSPRLLAALHAELARHPSRPPGIATCVAWLQEAPEAIGGSPIALRSLGTLRRGLFTAPGRDGEMTLLWREALASACYARLVASHTGFDAPLLTGAGLLHRCGEMAALRALARAEHATGERLPASALQRMLECRDDALVSLVTRSWSLPGELRLLIIRWRDEQHAVQRPRAVTLLMMVQALATALVHAEKCTPGLVEVAAGALHLPDSLVQSADCATPAIAALLGSMCTPPGADSAA